ncbi:30S ribosomal protein S16 [Candidatus Gracilibacteria bacterium]|nr:30S ribosomal protein S16 [Candidatus Gracilibacteria bacterium]
MPGEKEQAFFKLVAAEKSRAVQKKFIAELGHFNPHTEGGKGEFIFDKAAVVKFLTTGAQPSQTVARKLASAGVKEAERFVEKRATKPKKEEPKVEVAEEPAAPVEEAPAATEEVSEEKSE